MKKIWMKRIVTGIICFAMLISIFGINDLFVKADTTVTKDTNIEEKEEEFEVTDENSGFPIKEETVFITTDASGKNKSIQVSEWLKNPEGYKVLKDATNLNDIENISGEELFMREDENLMIQANGSDIYYRGEVDAETKTPISLKVNYELDGVEVQASELENKTGHLKMTIQYCNETTTAIEEDGELYNVSVPFAVTSVMMVPAEMISNLSINNGKAIETGSYVMILGFGFPGMNESFQLEEGVFTDSVVLEADVKAYSSQTIMTYCSNDTFSESDLEEVTDFDTITKALEEMTNSSFDGMENINSIDDLINELDDKKADLNRMNDGAKELKEGASKLSDGVFELKNNLQLFDTNMEEAANGAGKLSSGVSQASSSSQTLASGASKVNAGVSSLKTGINSMYSGIENAIYICNIALNLSSGVTDYDALCAAEMAGVITPEQAIQKATIEAGLTSILNAIGTDIAGAQDGLTGEQRAILNGQSGALSSIKSQMDAAGLKSGVESLSSGAAQVSSGASKLSSGLATISSSTGTLATAIDELSLASEKLEQGAVELANGSVVIADGTKEMQEGTNELVGLFDGDATSFVNTGKALKKAAVEYNTFTTLQDGEKGSVSFVIKTE